MIEVRVAGQPSLPWAEALRHATIGISETAPIGIVWMSTPQVQDQLREWTEQGIPCLAHADGSEEMTAARAAGAMQILSGLPDPDTVQDVVETMTRWTTIMVSARQNESEKLLEQVTKLEGLKALMDGLIDSAPEPIVAADLNGRVLVFNRAAERLLSYEADWARAHMHVTELYRNPADARRVLSEIREAEDQMVSGLEVRLRSRTGEHMPVALSAAQVLNADGEPVATIGVFADKREELSLRRRLEQTTEQLIQNEARMASVDLRGSAAQELNQPLTVAMGSLELVQMNPDLPPAASQRVARAYQQLQRVAEIVRAITRASSRQRFG
jgi:PAS domain S-box-containing protein